MFFGINDTIRQIAELKSQLAASDYKAIKHSEGLISEEDYAPIKAARQALRDQINILEAEAEEQAAAAAAVEPTPQLSFWDMVRARIGENHGNES